MNNEQDLKLTDLDYLIGSHHIQMVKAALPYMQIPEQKMLSVFVKFNELQRTISLFEQEEVATLGICSLENKNSPLDMLNAIKPYGNTTEQDFIDLISNFMHGSRLSNSFQQDNNSFDGLGAASVDGDSGSFAKKIPFEQIKGFLSPEQQSKLETMQIMMQTMQQFT